MKYPVSLSCRKDALESTVESFKDEFIKHVRRIVLKETLVKIMITYLKSLIIFTACFISITSIAGAEISLSFSEIIRIMIILFCLSFFASYVVFRRLIRFTDRSRFEDYHINDELYVVNFHTGTIHPENTIINIATIRKTD